MDTKIILLDNLRSLQKLLSPQNLSRSKYESTATQVFILLAAAEQQAEQLLGEVPHPLLKVLAEAQEMCDLDKIRRHISKPIFHFMLDARLGF